MFFDFDGVDDFDTHLHSDEFGDGSGLYYDWDDWDDDEDWDEGHDDRDEYFH